MSSYSIIREKIELWKKAKDEFHFSDFQDYLLVAFSDEESIYLNQKDKVETEKFIIFVLKFMRPYKTTNRVWHNVRYKAFYFVRHEYGDFYELDYIPLANGWKLDFTFVDPKNNNYQSAFESLTIVNVKSPSFRFDVDFKWDYLKWDMDSKISRLIQDAFASILRRSKLECQFQ